MATTSNLCVHVTLRASVYIRHLVSSLNLFVIIRTVSFRGSSLGECLKDIVGIYEQAYCQGHW